MKKILSLSILLFISLIGYNEYNYPKNNPIYDAEKTEKVDSYVRKDGTVVEGYERHKWGTVCRHGHCKQY